MDEYTFIVLAKLRAERLHLQRQQRHFCEKPPGKPPLAVRRPTRVFARRSQWREQS